MRAASAVLVVAGLLLVLGAQAPWVTCSQEPCDGFGLQYIWVRSGFDVGWGAATAFLGVAIVGATVLAAHRPVGLLMAGAAGVVAPAIATAFALRVWIVPDYDSLGPQVGFVATAIGGLIAALGAPWAAHAGASRVDVPPRGQTVVREARWRPEVGLNRRLS